jgi:hypothetical protein
MHATKMTQLIQQLENYTECWKQFIHFVNLARVKKFDKEEESHFLEVKTVMVQQLELILSSVEAGTPTKEEVLNLVGSAPSLRYLGEMNDSALRNLESQWHKLYIGWHSVLGQIKVQRQSEQTKSFFGAMFEKK